MSSLLFIKFTELIAEKTFDLRVIVLLESLHLSGYEIKQTVKVTLTLAGTFLGIGVAQAMSSGRMVSH